MENAGSGRVIHLDPSLACSGPGCARSAHIAIVEPDPVERGVWRLCPLCDECAYLIALATASATASAIERDGHAVARKRGRSSRSAAWSKCANV